MIGAFKPISKNVDITVFFVDSQNAYLQTQL
jgi:hypothetical protein